ncbi:MAG: FAD-binding protein [Calditrichaceae bacterium]|nr:FAD-binding protein [Calditrichaceae bacterium]HES59028.1 FAD-binding protein [Caldithrix sp.]
MQTLINDLQDAGIQFKENEALSAYTTFRIGGPARIFVSADTSEMLHQAFSLGTKNNIPLLVVGKGSNILVSDEGFDGLVIFNNATKWKIIGDFRGINQNKSAIERRFDQPKDISLSLKDDNNNSTVIVEVESGAVVGILMKQLFKQGVHGLEWFSGIPSTVGGAIYMNMHGADHFFGELVHSAVISDGRNIREADQDYFQFDYDWSILHQTREVVLSAKLILKKSDVTDARDTAKKWARYKANQPWRSAGCIFQNLTEEQKSQANLPSVSIGYLVDKVLHLKGTRKGDAIISENHAAFIENLGNAKAQDVFNLINLIKDKTKEKLGINLKMEVQLIGKFKN